MVGLKPRNEWLNPAFVLALIIAAMGIQDKFFTYNNETAQKVVRLEEWKAAAIERAADLSERVRRLEERGRQ